MSRIAVKQCTLTVGREPRFYAELGDTVSVRGADGKSLIAATLQAIEGDRVTVKHLHDDESQECALAALGYRHCRSCLPQTRKLRAK